MHGKIIHQSLYLHRSLEGEIPGIERAKALIPEGWDYTVVKHNRRTGTLSFIRCPKFDTAAEPDVGDAWGVRDDGTLFFVKAPSDPWVYHGKHWMVGEDYPGFDVEAARKRWESWQKYPWDRCRIGKRSFWEKCLANFPDQVENSE